MNEESVKKQAKQILDKFAKALEKINVKEVRIERDESSRLEGKNKVKIDRKIMFDNAPKKKNDYIEAERGGWI